MTNTSLISKLRQWLSGRTAWLLAGLIALAGFAAISLSNAAPAVADNILEGVKGGACLDNPPSFIDGEYVSGDECVEEDSGEGLRSVVRTALNVLTWIVGAAAVAVLILAGFRYVISGGSSSGVTGAKNMIIYALIGIIIALLAQVIVYFVIGSVGGSVEKVRTTCIVTAQEAADGTACQPPVPSDGSDGKRIECNSEPPKPGAYCKWVEEGTEDTEDTPAVPIQQQ